MIIGSLSVQLWSKRKKSHNFVCPILYIRRIQEPPRGVWAALVLQTNEYHWVLEETRAHQARAVVGIALFVCIYLLRPNWERWEWLLWLGCRVISNTDRWLTKDLSLCYCNGSQLVWYHGDTPLLIGNGCSAAMVDPDEWLTILISTLPVKGEESLDLQSPLTASEPWQFHNSLRCRGSVTWSGA